MLDIYSLETLKKRKLSQVDSSTIIGVCGSIKPAPGYDSKSAARSFMSYALNSLNQVYENIVIIDLRDYAIPLFSGQTISELNDSSLNQINDALNKCGAVLFAIPVYWSGVSGVFKNFIDVFCGPSYDLPNGRDSTIFFKKHCGLIVISADYESATWGCENAIKIVNSIGMKQVDDPVLIANPRQNNYNATTTSNKLIELCGRLAQAVLKNTK